MRILILISSLEGGGAERIATRVASALGENHIVHIMPFSKASTNPYPLSKKVKIDNAGLFDLRKRSRIPYRWAISVIYAYVYLSLFRLFFRPDVTLSFLNKPNLLNAFAWGKGRKIMSERNNPKKKGESHFLTACKAYRVADKVFFQSETVRGMFPEDIRRKGVIVPNPVEVTCKAEGRSLRIVASGRFRPQKNYPLLLRAFSRFSVTHPCHTLHITYTARVRRKMSFGSSFGNSRWTVRSSWRGMSVIFMVLLKMPRCMSCPLILKVCRMPSWRL